MSDEVKVANTLNIFFFEHSKKFENSRKNLLITNSFTAYQDNPTLNALLKYKDHPNVRVIKRVSQRFSRFYFPSVDKNTVLKEIRKLKSNKAVPETDILVKIFKRKCRIFCGIYLSLI